MAFLILLVAVLGHNLKTKYTGSGEKPEPVVHGGISLKDVRS